VVAEREKERKKQNEKVYASSRQFWNCGEH
jgi:hypothetical protein